MATFIFEGQKFERDEFDGCDIYEAFYGLMKSFGMKDGDAKFLVNGSSEFKVSQNYIIQPTDIVEFFDESAEEA